MGGGKSTTIGKAVLEIIPSLRGVSDAIEQQIDGKVVEVKVTPKVDPKAADTAGQQTRETVEKHTRDVMVTPKVDTRAAEQSGKATGEAVTKGAKDAVAKGDIGKTIGDEVTKTVQKTSPGKELAKIIVDGLADGVKDELRGGPLSDIVVDGLADGVKSGIDKGGLGKTILDTITNGVRSGDFGGALKDAVLPGIQRAGTAISEAATSMITNGAAGGLFKNILGSAGDAGQGISDLITKVEGLRNTPSVGPVQDGLKQVSDLLSGFDKDGNSGMERALGKVGGHAGQLSGMVGNVTKLVELMNDPKTEEALNKIPGIGVVKDATVNKPNEAGRSIRQWFQDHGITLPDLSKTEGGRKLWGEPDQFSGGAGSFDVGGFTGMRPIDQIAGVVHGKEYVVQAASTERIERQWPGYLDYLNKTGRLPGYESGGRVDKARQFAKSMDPATYLMGGFSTSQIDCSGLVSAVVNVATGRPPFQSRMSTVTEGSWLESLGFKPGRGGAGDLRVGWWDKGGGANGHTAGTLPDGTNFESNGSEGVVIGGKTGADDKQFTQHAYLPMDSIGNPNGPGATSVPDMLSALGLGSGGGAGSSAGVTPSGPSISGGGVGGGGSRGSSGSSGGGFSLPTSLTGLATLGIDSLPNPTDGLPDTLPDGTKNPWKQESAIKFNEAASAAVSGQLGSALGVFGVPNSPGWLQGISQLVGGIKIGGGSDGGFGSAAPAAAATAIGGLGGQASAAGMVHGGQAGQAPGPTVNYTINARDTEDAFVRAQQQERERAAAKLSRY